MTQDDIIKMAQEAGFAMAWMSHEEHQCIERLVNMAQAAEREACAKLVEPDEEHRRDANWGYLGGEDGVALLEEVAKKIRARGKQC